MLALLSAQELIDRIHVSLMAQRSTTQRLLAASGLPPLSDVDEAAHNTLNAVIDEWTAHVSPVTGRFLCIFFFDLGCVMMPAGDSWWIGNRW